MSSPVAQTLIAVCSVVLLSHSAPAQEAQELFLQQCARCHGETGDGQGTEELDRPARSFQDGGFSFGDTELAIYRTITHGIPGSPMPAFGDGMTDDQRRAVAAYVRTLCPPRDEASDEETELVVGEHPLVAKGLLRPVVSGANLYPRGLLVGTPDGLTFEYRADDLRLLAVRQGPFARREDWTGRGGAPLQPLGSVVWLNEGGDPPELFFVFPPDATRLMPLKVVVTSVATPRAGAAITSNLVDPGGRVVAQLVESPQRLSTSFGSGFTRRFTVTVAEDTWPLLMKMPWTHEPDSLGTGLGRELTRAEREPDIAGVDGLWHGGELRVLTWTSGIRALGPDARFGQLHLSGDRTERTCTFEMHVLPLTELPDDRATLARELLR